MILHVNDSMTIEMVKKEFNQQFPYLKLEFFSLPHEKGQGSPKDLMIDDHTTIKECRTQHINAGMEIQPMMKVEILEQAIKDVFGLSVQLFRKSGKVWIETINTDSMTLEEQNKLGEEHTHPA